MTNSNFEIRRKTFHLLGLLCPLIYYFLPKYIAVILSFLAMILVLCIDIYRHDNKIIQRCVDIFLSNFIRDSEKTSKKLSGSGWMFIGIFLSCLLYSKKVAIFSWLVLFVSDSLAALVGTYYGRNKIFKDKTLEGSIAFFISVLVMGLSYDLIFGSSFTFIEIVLAGLVGTFVELYSKDYGYDDNFTIPIIVGLVLSVI